MSDHEIPLSRPDISDLEVELVSRTLRSGRLSMGPMRDQFERMVALRAGCRHGIAVSSGTAGLHAVLAALNVGPGDEVITTPFSFVASANCILYMGATPVFVDIEPKSLNMDPDRLEQAITTRTKAIIAVEAFGNPTHMDAYAAIAARHEIPLVEDACEAIGCSLKGRPCGSFGRAAVFAFYPNKQITTGEGGVIVTDDERLADVCRSLRNQGRSTSPDSSGLGSWLLHERLGFNYRLSELQAALGVAQMRRFDEIVQRRQQVARLYLDRLLGNPHVIAPTIGPDVVMSWFVFVVRLVTGYTIEERDRILQGMRNHDIGVSNYFPCIHLQPYFRRMFGFREGMFPVAESVCQRTIALPFHSELGERDIDLVVQTLELMISRENIKRS